VYFEPRDGVVCRFPTEVRIRLLNGTTSVVDEVVTTTGDAGLDAPHGDGTPLVVDARRWAMIQVISANDAGPPDFGECELDRVTSVDRIVVEFGNGSAVDLADEDLGGCGGLQVGPVQSVSAASALDDITQDRP
jgi:hypothetical protein